MSNTNKNTGATCAHDNTTTSETQRDAYTLEQLAMAEDIIGRDGCVVIHAEYLGSVSDRRCYRRHIITLDQWRRITCEDERRWWRARAKYGYFRFGYLACKWSRRRWGDGAKIIDTWNPLERLPGADFVAVDRDIDDVAKEMR